MTFEELEQLVLRNNENIERILQALEIDNSGLSFTRLLEIKELARRVASGDRTVLKAWNQKEEARLRLKKC